MSREFGRRSGTPGGVLADLFLARFDVKNVEMKELDCSGRGPGEGRARPGEAGRGLGEDWARNGRGSHRLWLQSPYGRKTGFCAR